jgi:hypothetical protein
MTQRISRRAVLWGAATVAGAGALPALGAAPAAAGVPVPAGVPAPADVSHWRRGPGDWGDQGDGTYRNPVLNTDFSDPEVIRVGEDFYLVSSEFHFMGMTVLHSRDLVNWRFLGRVYDRLDISPYYDTPRPSTDPNTRYSKGSWTPAMRHHDGRFWIYFCTPTEGLFMTTAKTPDTAKNTDGIDIDSSSNATVNDSSLMDGDDCVAIQTNASASSNTTVENTHCYGTHGLSIGSETKYSVSSVLMQDNTIQGTDTNGTQSSTPAGLRIKSYSSEGGTVSGIDYESTCMTGLKYPLDFDPFYSSSTGTDYPYFKSVTVNGATAVSSVSGAQSVLKGYSSTYPLGLTLENVDLDVPTSTSQYANVQLYDSDVEPTGTGVTDTDISGTGSAPTCSFPSYPAL